MRYVQNDEMISIGDQVVVEGNVFGRVVCDYDQHKCLEGYERWLTTEELTGAGKLAIGIMVETAELGFLHYAEADVDVSKARILSTEVVVVAQRKCTTDSPFPVLARASFPRCQ